MLFPRNVAQANGLTVAQLQQYNPSLDCNTAIPGTVVCVGTGEHPAQKVSRAVATSYCKNVTIAQGNTCSDIASQNSITLAQLEVVFKFFCCSKLTSFPHQQYNPNTDCTKLIVGNRLCVTSGTLPPPWLPPANANGTCSYIVVQQNEQCSDLPAACNLSQESFNYANPTLNCSTLQPMQAACCSAGTKPNRAPNPYSNGTCFWHRVVANDSCSLLANEYDLTNAKIESFNQQTWQWKGCGDVQIGGKVCLSTGTPPLPDVDPTAQCGLASAGNVTCPLNACCSKWGWCGMTEDYCTQNTTAPPGNGCQTNCGMEAPPAMKVCDNVMKIAVGYYEGWAETRRCMKYSPEDINPFQWTHIHFAFGVIDTNLQCNFGNSTFDLNQVQRLVSLKQQNPALKIIFSIGGWAFQNPGPTVDRFKNMVATQASRATFIQSAVSFLSANNLDGLDFDWEYPTTSDRDGLASDKGNYLSLVQEMRAAFGTKYSLSIAAPAGFWYLQGFDIAKMAPSLDYIVYMTYDLHGNWDYSIKSLGPWLNAHNNMTEISASLTMIQKAGVPSNKILLGIGFYGRSFLQTDPNCSTAGICTFQNPGSIDPTIDNYVNTATPGACTQTGGVLAFFEIEQIRKLSSTVRSTYFDPKALTNIMTYNSNDWIAFEDQNTLALKIAQATSLCLGGVIVWSIDQDDAENSMAGILSNVGGLSPFNLTDIDDIIDDYTNLGYLPDTFFNDVVTRTGAIITQRQLTVQLSFQLVLFCLNKMLQALLTLFDLLIGDGRQFFSCNGKCPTESPTEDSTVGSITWSLTNPSGFYALVSQRLQVDSRNIQFVSTKYSVATDGCCGMSCSRLMKKDFFNESAVVGDSFDLVSHLDRRGCTRTVTWNGIPKIKTGATVNYYSSQAFDLYQQYSRDSINSKLSALPTGDGKAFFNCNNSPCANIDFSDRQTITFSVRDQNGWDTYLSQNLGISESDIDYGASQVKTYMITSDRPGESYRGSYTLKGIPELVKNSDFPPDPKPAVLSFISSSQNIISTATSLIQSTSTDDDTLRVSIEGLTHQLAIANQTIDNMNTYEAQVKKDEDIEAAKKKAHDNIFLTLIEVAIGIVLGALLPGIGEVASLSIIRTSVEVTEAAEDADAIAQFGANLGRTALDGVEALSELAGDVFESLPAFLQKVVNLAKTAFDNLEPVIECAANTELQGAATDAIDMPFSQNLRRSLEGPTFSFGFLPQQGFFESGPFALKEYKSSIATRQFVEIFARDGGCVFQSTGRDMESKPLYMQSCLGILPANGGWLWFADYDASQKDVLSRFSNWRPNIISNPNAGEVTSLDDKGITAARDDLLLKPWTTIFGKTPAQHTFELQEVNVVLGSVGTSLLDSTGLCNTLDELKANGNGDLSEDLRQILNGDDNMIFASSRPNSIKGALFSGNTLGSAWTDDEIRGGLAYLKSVDNKRAATATAIKDKLIEYGNKLDTAHLNLFTAMGNELEYSATSNMIAARNSIRGVMEQRNILPAGEVDETAPARDPTKTYFDPTNPSNIDSSLKPPPSSPATDPDGATREATGFDDTAGNARKR
ncbi:hypothetical protein HK100_011889, partial [Physocladia obscura]